MALFAVPALAGTLYISGGPDISAAISGTNEFSPGAGEKVSVLVENRGLIDLKIVRSDIVSRDDLPTTAKLVRVALLANGTPMTVKSDPQMIGDVEGGNTRTVSFDVKIDNQATGGIYTALLRTEYTYLYSAESEGQDNIHYYYKTVTEDLPLTINIRPSVELEVQEAVAEHLDVGAEGYLTLTLKNIGSVDAQKAIARIAQNGHSPVMPTDSSVYIGNFPAGSTITARYKVAVSSSATENQVYPLDVYLDYLDFEGDTITSDPVTFGVPVGGKIEFSVISAPIQVRPGEKRTIEVEYKNTGSAEVFRAQARLSAVDPFTSSDDTAFLGDLKPGQSVIARYEVSADGTATIKSYGLDSEIRYRDSLDNPQISKTMKVEMEVVASQGIFSQASNPLVIALLGAAILGGLYYIAKVRRKK
ncbi:MAG: S-layer protein [Methanomicrobiales archaeon]|nr:S-layer protein [Methanomicrobiales archaeon]